MNEGLDILVVDDDEVDRALVRRVLRTAGLILRLQDVDTCAGAIALLQQQPFDCVFVDYLLPDGDGLALVEQIRRLGFTVPLVVLTGQGDEQIAVAVMKAGASDYLSKAKISPETLSRSLQYAVRLHKAEHQAALANQRLSESEVRFRSLVQNSRDIIAALTAQGTVQYTSPSITGILGYQPEDLLGRNAFEQVHPEDLTTVQAAVVRVLQNPTVAVPVELRYRHADGSWVYLEAIANNLLNNTSVKSVIVNSRDITARKRAEISQQLLAEASILLGSSLDSKGILGSLASLVVPTLADFCVFDVVTATQEVQRVAWQHRDSAKQEWFAQVQPYLPDPAQLPPAIALADADQATFVPEVSDAWLQEAATSPTQLQFLRDLQFCSLITVPLVAHSRKLGTLTFCLLAGSGRVYTQDDLRLAEDLGRQTALMLDNVRLYQEAQEVSENLRQAVLILGEQQQQLRTLQQLTNLVNQRLADLPGLLQGMVGAVCEVVPRAKFCLIMLYSPETQRLELTAQAGSDTARLRIPGYFQATEELLAQVFLTGISQLVQGDTANSGKGLPAAVCAVAIESAQAGRLGVLAVGNWEDEQAYTFETRFLLGAFGEQAAIALNNARLINTLEEREERLAAQNQLLAQQNQELEYQRQQIQLQNLQLLEAAQLKSQFLATMSHELRTPINAILGFSQLLLRQQYRGLALPQIDMVERIFNNGRNLLALINDVLDFSKIEAGCLKLKLEEFNLAQEVVTATEELRSLATQKNLTLQIYTDLKDPIVVNDRIRLRQILVNLLSNAIKFTDAGRVQVRLHDSSPGRLLLVVQDTGIGIASADLRHVFTKFWQADQTTTRRFAGTGLGLAITEQLVQLMQGAVRVESKVGQGSSFAIEFPRQVLPATQTLPAAQQPQLLK